MEKKYCIGIDSGSTFSKVILMQSNKVIDFIIQPTSWNPEKTATQQLDMLCKKHNLQLSDCNVTTTGYGRESIPSATKSVTEITCHAKGGVFLNKDINGILDIGGQDSKVISVKNNKVDNFLMNDKCAAGTGKFLDMLCRTLEITFDEIDNLVDFDKDIKLNNMCAVFAESEIIGLLAKNISREKIIGAAILSIATRMSQMMNRVQLKPNNIILLTGGLSNINCLKESIETVSNIKIISHQHSIFAGAIGAALLPSM